MKARPPLTNEERALSAQIEELCRGYTYIAALHAIENARTGIRCALNRAADELVFHSAPE